MSQVKYEVDLRDEHIGSRACLWKKLVKGNALFYAKISFLGVRDHILAFLMLVNHVQLSHAGRATCSQLSFDARCPSLEHLHTSAPTN